jgi:hypothetical protein
MKKELFKLLIAEFQKLGINPTQWLGTRTNVKRMNKKNMADSVMNEYAVNNEIEQHGLERIKKLFSEEAKYLGQLNDMQAQTLLNNLKTLNKVVNPPPPPEAQIYQFSKLPGDPLTPDEYTSKSVADQEKIQSALLHNAMKVSAVDRTLAKRLNLDMSKVSDWEKLQTWKDRHGVPDWAKEGQGVASLFKVVEDNPLADIQTQLDLIEKEGKSFIQQAQELADKAWELSPEGIAYREMVRKDILRRENEGKGFAGGVFGARSDGFYRALVRPFLIAQHEKGKIKLADNVLESLKESNDIKSGGGLDFMYPDPVRVFRQHYGDDAFDLIPDLEKFGMGPSGYGPTSETRIKVLEEVIGEPIMKVGSDKPGNYLTKGEFQAKLDHEDEVKGYIDRREGRFGSMDSKEIAQELAEREQRKMKITKLMNDAYPPKEKVKMTGDENLDYEWKETPDGWVKVPGSEGAFYRFGEKNKKLIDEGVKKISDPEVSGIDDTLKSDFEKLATDPETRTQIGKNITGGFKKTKQRETAIKDLKKEKGQDYTPTEDEIEQYIIGRQTALKSDRETILKSSPEDKELWGLSSIKTTKKKDPFGIRLMKNFDQDLTDEGLAQEGYNLQEIDILKRARAVMKDPKKDVRHPTEAMRWVRGDMADEAGVDIDDFMTDFQWDDTFDPSDNFAQGGRVGYRYGTGEEGVQSLPVDQMQEIEGQMAGVADDDLVQRRANELALEIFGVEDYFKLTDRLQDALWRRAERELNEKAQGGGVGSMFRRV